MAKEIGFCGNHCNGYNYPKEFKDINDVDKILEIFEKGK